MAGTQQLRDSYLVQYDAYENPDSFKNFLELDKSGVDWIISKPPNETPKG